MHLGHTDRIAAFRDPISEVCAIVSSFNARLRGKGSPLFALNRALPRHCPWSYAQTVANAGELAFLDWEMLVETHESILHALTNPNLVVQYTSQIGVLNQMAWLYERQQRAAAGTAHTVLDIGPISDRLIAVAAMAVEELWEPLLTDVIDIDALPSWKAVDFPNRNISSAQRDFIAGLVEANSASFELGYPITLCVRAASPNSDCINSIAITIDSGSVDAVANLVGTVKTLSDRSVVLATEPSEGKWLAATGAPVTDLVDHPLLRGLELTFESRARDPRGARLFHNGAHATRHIIAL